MMPGFAVVVSSVSLGRDPTRLLLLRGMFSGATSVVSRTGATRVVRPLAPCHAGLLDVKAPAAGSVDDDKSFGWEATGAATGTGREDAIGAAPEGDARGVATAGERGEGTSFAGGGGGAAFDDEEDGAEPVVPEATCTVRRSRLAKLAMPLAADAALLSLATGSVGLVGSLPVPKPRAYSIGFTWLGRPFCELVSSPVCGSQRTSPPL